MQDKGVESEKQVEKIPKKAKKTYPKGRLRIKVNVANCRYEVIRDVIREHFRMRLIEEEQLPGQHMSHQEEFDIYWSDTAQEVDRLLKIKPY